MGAELYRIVEWVRREGDVCAFDRLRMKVLGVTLRERIFLPTVKPDTSCSDDALRQIRQAAVAVVGKPCPY